MFKWLANRLVGHVTDPVAAQSAEKLYAAIVAQARHPFFYKELAVADTIQGRFEMVALHMFLVLDRLRKEGEDAEKIAQELVDVMFQDMDDVAREIGVGDMGVASRIKKLARSFRSRLEYYKKAIESDDDEALSKALLEIYFDNQNVRAPEAGKLANYLVREQSAIEARSVEEMLALEPLFGEPDKDANKGHLS